jgi:hypothetical protein
MDDGNHLGRSDSLRRHGEWILTIWFGLPAFRVGDEVTSL